MAHANGTSSLTRTRSLRAPANISKPAQHPSRGNTAGISSSSTTTTTATQTTATATATTTGPSLPGPSNLSLFLTNLRLLDLDLHSDWPDITAATFSAAATTAAATAQGGQKRRIQAVEWALYHLFALWDPDEARAKLQPFFPPLDQVQSLNLRAALLRALETAKKAGALGRDAVVRRTMLDECKGERLEEVLAVLSSAVLKKVAAEGGRGGYPALAQVLALENRGYSGERAELAALVLAHKVSLRRGLDEKNAARVRFREFSDVLVEKQEGIARRRARAEAAAERNAPGNVLSEDQKAAVCRTVQNNWTGNERWMDALLYGDSKAHKDGLLSAPFDRVWRRVQSGRLAELEDHSVGLIEQLESRVRGQQARLEKWQGFRQRIFGVSDSGAGPKESQPQPKHKGIDLGFRAHQDLQLGRMSPRKLVRANPKQLDSHYEALVNGLKSDLESAGQGPPQILSFFQRPRQLERPLARATEEPNSAAEEISDISDLDETPPLPRPSPSRREPIRVSEEPAFEPVLRKAKTFDDDHTFPDDIPLTPSRLRRSATIQSLADPAADRPPAAPHSPTRPLQRRQTSAPKVTLNPRRPTSPPRGGTRAPRSPPRRAQPPAPAPALPPPASPEPPPSPSPDPSPPSPPSTRQLADQILASVGAASPSPAKNRKPRHTLSLAERTRLSMARRTSRVNLRAEEEYDRLGDDDDDDDGDEVGAEEEKSRLALSVPVIAEPTPPEPGLEEAEGAGQGAGYEDLVARTRRSMAGFEAARQRAQAERRRSVRRVPVPVTPGGGARGSSYFPAVDEEEGEGESTLLLTERLLAAGHEDDYEAVFKSRPKLKSSPVGTPVRELWDD